MSIDSRDYGELISRRLDLTGDGTGAENMNVDGSVTPQTFSLIPATGEVICISRVIFYVEDAGTFDASKWGNGIVVANGLDLNVITVNSGSGSLIPSVKTTGELAGICHDVNHFSFGTGNEILSARLTFSKFGKFVRLNGDAGTKLEIVINDDLTGLVYQYVTAQGYYERK